jgi:hypothetical protein
MLDLQHQHNKCTTTSYTRMDSTHWGPLSCEELLCICCVGVVQESNPKLFLPNELKTFVNGFKIIFSLVFAYGYFVHTCIVRTSLLGLLLSRWERLYSAAHRIWFWINLFHKVIKGDFSIKSLI